MRKVLRHGFLLSLLLVFVSPLVWSPSAHGQMADDEQGTLSDTEGLFLEAHLQGHGVTVGEDDTDGGNGLGIKAGYGFTPLLTGYLGIDVASMEVADPATQNFTASEYTLAYVDLGAQVNFRSGSNSLVPYLAGSLSGIASVYTTNAGDVTFSGSGASVGGGIQYFFSPQFALNGGLDFTFGSYDQVEANGETESVDLGFTGARIDIGISWYPFDSK